MSNDFIVKPIEKFPAYLQQGNNFLGIPDTAKSPADFKKIVPVIEVEGKEEQRFFSEFYIKSGKIYFTIKREFPIEDAEPEVITKYCVQENGEISYITKTKFGSVPELVRVEAEEGDYKFSIGDYSGQTISIAERDYSENMVFIDGFLIIEGGVLINAIEGRGASRPNGLLFWPDGKRNMDLWKGPGRFWK